MKKIISSLNAPKAVGPYSQAIVHDYKFNMELSGQIGIDPKTGILVEGGVIPELEQILKNIEAILSEAGWSFDNLIKVRIYLVDMADYKQVNEIYAKKFKKNFPARVAVAVKALPLNANIEIECCAAGNELRR